MRLAAAKQFYLSMVSHLKKRNVETGTWTETMETCGLCAALHLLCERLGLGCVPH